MSGNGERWAHGNNGVSNTGSGQSWRRGGGTIAEVEAITEVEAIVAGEEMTISLTTEMIQE